MARSSGFKINRNLKDFLEVIGAGGDLPDKIAEIRAITNRYIPMENIVNDLNEIELEKAVSEVVEGETEEAA